jgi:hypothetical protein
MSGSESESDCDFCNLLDKEFDYKDAKEINSMIDGDSHRCDYCEQCIEKTSELRETTNKFYKLFKRDPVKFYIAYGDGYHVVLSKLMDAILNDTPKCTNCAKLPVNKNSIDEENPLCGWCHHWGVEYFPNIRESKVCIMSDFSKTEILDDSLFNQLLVKEGEFVPMLFETKKVDILIDDEPSAPVVPSGRGRQREVVGARIKRSRSSSRPAKAFSSSSLMKKSLRVDLNTAAQNRKPTTQNRKPTTAQNRKTTTQNRNERKITRLQFRR